MNWKIEPRSYCTAIVEVDGGDIRTVAEFQDRDDAELCMKCIEAVRSYDKMDSTGPSGNVHVELLAAAACLPENRKRGAE